MNPYKHADTGVLFCADRRAGEMCVMLVPSGYGASRIDISIHTHISITIYINSQVCQKVLR